MALENCFRWRMLKNVKNKKKTEGCTTRVVLIFGSWQFLCPTAWIGVVSREASLCKIVFESVFICPVLKDFKVSMTSS